MLFDTFNSNRERDGYINLDFIDKHLIQEPTYGSRKNKKWFEHGGEQYLFKPNKNAGEDIKEVINEELAKMLGINNAEYDLGVYKGKKGVISKNFIPNKSIYLTGLLAIIEYKLGFSNDLYTYYQTQIKADSDDDIIEETIDELLRRHILDIFTAQRDRNIDNTSFFKTNRGLVLAPRYDSAGSFLSISKRNKMVEFLTARNKSELLIKYGGIRTKFRILPGSAKDDSIEEYFDSLFSEELPQLLRKRMLSLDDYISQAEKIDLDDIYYILSNYGINLPQTERYFYKKIYDIKAEAFENAFGQAKEKLKVKVNH